MNLKNANKQTGKMWIGKKPQSTHMERNAREDMTSQPYMSFLK